ncbi:MAG: hypothetical protein VKJ02_19225 [Snowella sp.]|nr:hypothetical protein [Snowella sp.]
MKKMIASLVIAGLMVISVGTQKQWPLLSQVEAKANWVLLGERIVADKLDHDTIPVTIARGNFRRIQFRVKEQAIQILRLVVHYGNGDADKIEVRQSIPAGGESRIIDLKGGDRIIQKIEFWYEAKSLGNKRALVRVYGIR